MSLLPLSEFSILDIREKAVGSTQNDNLPSKWASLTR